MLLVKAARYNEICLLTPITYLDKYLDCYLETSVRLMKEVEFEFILLILILLILFLTNIG